MLDFFTIREEYDKKDKTLHLWPNFLVTRSTDLMVKGGSFHAVWDEESGLWSTDEYSVQRLVDDALRKRALEIDEETKVSYLRNNDTQLWAKFRRYLSNISDNYQELDAKLIFADAETTKDDFATKKLSYSLSDGECSAWKEILTTLYNDEERTKIEWAIGSVVSGDSRYLQKFMVFYGPPGTGKSTILDIISQLFKEYTSVFDAKALGSSGNQFATSVFKSNPLVAIDHDTNMSKMDENTVLNSIVSHEDMLVNEKFKPSYTAKANAFLFVGTNLPVKISDAKSGLIRRLIDVQPTGSTLPASKYHTLMGRIKFELGAIAQHCLSRYLELGRHYYDDYRPTSMMYKTDHVLAFVSDNFETFAGRDFFTSKQIYSLYVEYCAEVGVEYKLTRQKLETEMTNYFEQFHEAVETSDGERLRSVYEGFQFDKVRPKTTKVYEEPALIFDETESIFDTDYSSRPAQLANDEGYPRQAWARTVKTLSEIDTSKLHYVKIPLDHIVLDFDLKDKDGEKNLDANIKAASKYPPTYAELSKSGKGVHLHYIYEGDVDELAALAEEDVEIKVFRGKASLRRKLTLCNKTPIASLSTGLPLKEKKESSDVKQLQSEQGLRNLIYRNLKKEIHPGTKPSVEFIKKILDDAYESDLAYDVTDMRKDISTFASRSTNHPIDMLRLVNNMKFVGKVEVGDKIDEEQKAVDDSESRLAFFDVEVFPNLLLVCWKYEGNDNIVSMVNPEPHEIEKLLDMKLVGFNNRKYDNHILVGRHQGLTNQGIYNLSQNIINKKRDAYIASAYGISYADIWDFSSEKMSLKKWEIELGLRHLENRHPWDEPINMDTDLDEIIEYCKNDVIATEAVFNERIADFHARKLLADISGLRINDKTENHTAKIIFGDDKSYKDEFVYTDLSKEFPGYRFDFQKIDLDDGSQKTIKTSTYKDEIIGEGGYVYAEPGIHRNVALLDIASMHPTTIRELKLFGKYTPRFYDLVEARLAIKRGDYETARTALDGKLAPYLKDDDKEAASRLSWALKIVINIVYGLTATSWDSKFSDKRNVDNIVAKRGALFMVELKEMIQSEGFTVAHIKTDSVKIPDATPEIIGKVFEFGKKYGYSFEHEDTYKRMVLVNNAVYVAQSKESGKWEATGAQFKHPYVFKRLFTKEEVTPDDLAETKEVQNADIYLEYVSEPDSEVFIGSIGRFYPVKPDASYAAYLWRKKDDTKGAVTGTKGHTWSLSDAAEDLEKSQFDFEYGESLVKSATETIDKFGEEDTGMNELFRD